MTGKIKKQMWTYFISILICVPSVQLKAQHLSKGFEVRYFSNDTKANGETDFKGETSTLDTDQRIDFLKYYADQVSAYYSDEKLNTEVASDSEATALLGSIRPQPLPVVRKKILLDEWKYLGYKAGQHEKVPGK